MKRNLEGTSMKNIYRSTHRAVWSLILLGAAFVASCGGDEASGGDNKDCKPNDTRTCVGPGACAGGQVCGADGTWGACDCGAAGSGGGGTAGASGSGGGGGADASAGSGGVGGASGSGGDGGPTDSGPGGSPNCPQGKGPVMIDVGAFCIDSTEVTQKQYKEFHDSLAGTKPKVPECGTISALVDDPLGCLTQPDEPVVCANWCTAAAFCTWAGKRLCGKVGGGPLPDANFGIPWENEWAFACTQGAKTKYPWGDQPAANCVTDQCPLATCSGKVATMPNCRGAQAPFDQIYDLIGNVAEWTNTHSPDTWVRIAGGARDGNIAECVKPTDIESKAHSAKNVGVRCCADHVGGG